MMGFEPTLTLVDVLTFPTEVGRPGRLALAHFPGTSCFSENSTTNLESWTTTASHFNLPKSNYNTRFTTLFSVANGSKYSQIRTQNTRFKAGALPN